MKGDATMFTIWNVTRNTRTFNFGEAEWVVDGELGRMVYPGNWDKSIVCNYYSHGWSHAHKEM